MKPRRFNWFMLVGILALAGVVFVVMFSRESASVAANRFLVALAEGDVDTLTTLTYMEGEPEAAVRAQWERSVDFGRYYRFAWMLKHETSAGPDTATVTIDFNRNAGQPESYPEPFQIPMVRKDGAWKVDVRSLSRQLYPALPR